MAFLIVLVPNHVLGKILDHAIENRSASIPMSTMSSISYWKKGKYSFEDNISQTNHWEAYATQLQILNYLIQLSKISKLMKELLPLWRTGGED
jgi:hypothetical protein